MSTQRHPSGHAIKIDSLEKVYPIWHSPRARLKSLLMQSAYRILPLRHLGLGPLSNWTSRYGQSFHALSDINLKVRKGECLGIIGKNGSGKSTLLQLMAGILQPTRGQVRVDGKVAALLELGSGFNEEFTGRENVFLNAAIYGNSREQTERVFDDIAAFADIGPFMEQKVKTYSSGMIVRLGFSVLAHLRPDILIIDEALAVGDAFFVQKCMRWLQDFVEDKTVVMVSHDMSAITRFSDRVLWLDQGRAKFLGDPKRATELYLQSQYEHVVETRFSNAGDDETHDAFAASDRSELVPADTRHAALRESGDTRLPFFHFDPQSEGFGQGKVRIESLELRDVRSGQRLSVLHGGEPVCVSVEIRATERAASPIIGFGVKNRLGQELFHDNTYLTSHLSGKPPLTLQPGERAVAEFEFVMPYLPSGDHFLFAAVALGTHAEHTQQHWIHEAIRLQPVSDRIVLGLIGLPMQDIRFDKSP